MSGPLSGFLGERAAGRAQGQRRSLNRAAELARELQIDWHSLPPTLVVVGSKGKGTTVAVASSVLHRAGLRVGTLTSPGLRDPRERIRLAGQLIGIDDFADLARRLDTARQGLTTTDGYLSPTGLFTLAAVRHFLDVDVEVMVLEAGLGGISDEVSLMPPTVVAVTSIFGEHRDILGPRVIDIARDKIGLVRDTTDRVLSLQQRPDVAELLATTCGTRLIWVDPAPANISLPPPPVGGNAALGRAAGVTMASLCGVSLPDDVLHDAVAAVRLPGRLSLHERKAATWGVDSPVSGAGAAAALRWFRQQVGEPTCVVLCVPDGKDRAGMLAALAGCRVIPVSATSDDLRFDAWERPLPLLEHLDDSDLGPRVLALGTVTSTVAVLTRLQVDTGPLF